MRTQIQNHSGFLHRSCKKSLPYLLLLFLSLSILFQLRSEGTKEIQPSVTDYGYVVLDPAWSPFGLYGSPSTSRIHISICNLGEKIYYGFNQPQKDVKYRIKDPNGNIVVSQTTVPSSGSGYISSYTKAVNGPSAIVGGSGYNALSYTPTMTGDYYIEFQLPSGNPRREFTYFDITVASSSNTAILGRVWCQSWMFSTGNYGRSFKGLAYIYADDGIVTSIDFNGMDPYVFVLNANKTGTGNTGNTAADRQSKVGVATYPQYKVFLNNPDESCFPTGSFGQITGQTTISGCPPSNFCLNIFVNKPGTAEILLDLNGISGYQANSADRILSQDITPPSGCIPWDGKDGLGNTVTTSTTITTTVNFYNGLTHIPLYDVERNPNGYKVALVRPTGPPPPKLYWDDSQIPAAAGNTNLTGCSSPCHTWDWTCCSNNSATDYGNTNTINTWWYADSTKSISSNVVPPGIIVDADTRIPVGGGSLNDTTICGDMTTYVLSGKVTNATGGQWTTLGSGSFSPDNTSLTGTYNISAADRAAKKVKLILSSTGNGACAAASDSLIIRFQGPPTVDAGSDVTVCSNNPAVKLNGAISDASGGKWTSTGTGTFSPSNTALNATYTPSAADITAKSVTLTLTSTGNGKCNSVSDQIKITIQDPPTVNAGSSQSVCSGSTVSLSGSVSNATTQSWSGGSGTFSPNANTLNATYTPTASEIASGVINLTLTANRSGCSPVQSNVKINFSGSPTVNAGSDQSVCSNNSKVTLNGSGTNATTFKWSGGSGIFTPNNATLNATYTPAASEVTSGSVTLTLTASAPGCSDVTDNVKITFTGSPTANAGTDGSVCANNPNYTLKGSVTGATGGTWTGLGTFTPNANTLNAVYTPDASEIVSGVAAVVLKTTGNGTCNSVTDTMLLVISPAPTANAGADQSVCTNNPDVTLAGSAKLASTFSWSGGSGTFSPNSNTLNAKYTPSVSEIATGNVTITLTASRSTCNPVTDQMVITITPVPTANAGADQSVCYNNANVALNGSVSVATGGTWSGGSGTFTPNANTLNASYSPSASEKNSGSFKLILTTSGNGNCKSVTDTVAVSVTPAPTTNAGNDQSVCGNNAAVTLSGSVTVATDGKWSGGTGTFSPANNILNPTYTPSASEIAAGSVTLTLTSDNNQNCNSVSDQVAITITSAPTVNAGSAKTICADNPTVNLNASETISSGGIWSGGTGTFNPNNTTANASYTATLAEVLAGKVSLTFTTTGNGNCNAVADKTDITIVTAPTVNAGPDQTLCATTSSVPLSGSFTGASGVQWTSAGSGSFSPSNTSANASYVPSAADITSGSVTLTLATTGSGTCNPVNDQVVINFTQAPTVNAGPDQIVCTNAFPVKLNGSGSSAKWSGGSGTFSPGISTFNATYIPSAAEIAAGTVTLTLTTNPSGACPTISDHVTITLPPAPIANAGSDITICGDATSVSLNGSVTNATGGFWSTTGTGSFTPNNNNLNAQYHPSATDIANGKVTLTLSTLGNGSCSGNSDSLVLTIQPAVSVDAGPDQVVCGDNSSLTLAGSATNANSISWATSGSGSFSPNNTTVNATYQPSAADISNGQVTLTLSSPAQGSCTPKSDDVVFTINPAPVSNAGPDQTVCKNSGNVTLNGSISGATSAVWTTTGTGTFVPDANTLNASYVPTASDKSSGIITFTLTTISDGICSTTSDQMIVSFSPAPVVSAGVDQSVCADIGNVSINGSVTVATGGIWTTSGDGSFANANALNTSYSPGASDIKNGSVILTLTSTGNGNCIAVTDQMTITISPAPVVDAGSDRNVCANNPSLTLQGSVTIATGGIWSGGTGSFSPDNTTLNAVYTPSSSEIASGSVTLTLTSTGNGLCNPKSDQVTITIAPAPTINAGSDQTVCADSSGISLNGTFTVASGAIWTTSGSGNFFPNNITQNATYVPSAADKSTGSITLTYTTTGNGNCNAVTDQMLIAITPAPTADAGPNQIVCANNATTTLNGTVTIASGGVWTTSGTGSFSNPNSLSATYTPSSLDTSAGSVTLTLTTSGNGSCKSVFDQMKLVITTAPTVNAGPDQTVCANNADISLNGSFSTASGISWTSNGSGIFNPDANTANAVYTPSASDISAGFVTLTITTVGNGLCNAVTDQISISIIPAPVINAGTDQTVCADTSSIPLNGSISNSTGAVWTTSGSGIFAPSASTLNASYIPSSADISSGTVTLTLTSTGNTLCNAVTDQMVITITPAPVVNAGTDSTICGDLEFFNLSGSVSNAAGGKWTTSGSGLFSPDASTLSSQYFFSNSELAGGSITLTLTSTGNGTCKAVSDQKVIKINPVPTVNAGADQTLCANNANVSLSGSLTNASGRVWISSGDGTFSDPSILNPVYTPSAADISSGQVILTLQTSGSGACNPVSDQMIVTFTPAPTVDAGPDQSVCANNNNVALNGSITVASGGTWSSSGSGFFSPSVNTLNASYKPSATDIATGTVTLTLTSSGNGNCAAVSKQMTVTITPAPTVNPGGATTVCANTSGVALNGIVTVATGGTWTTGSGTGTFVPDNNTLNATFIPSGQQIANGRANLTLTTTGNGNCAAVSANIVITIQPVPTVNAGPDVSVCTGTPSINLNGSVSNASGATWTSSGSGTFVPNANTLNATYQPSAGENANGNTITLTLTSVGNGACSAASDDVKVTFQTIPVSAGPDQTVCSNSLPVQLNGSGNGTWSGGAGTFSDPNSLSTSYTPDASEIPGSVTLTLTGVAIGACVPGTDQVTITILDGPEVNAGADQTICANNSLVNVSGVINNATDGTWTTEGSGTFANANSATTTYTPSASDITSGSVKLALTSTGNGSCNAASDTLLITFTPAPVVDAGTDIAACANGGAVNINGSVTISPSATWSIVSGNGSIANTSSLTTSYTPDPSDISAGTVVLRLTSDPSGNCNQVSDDVTINFGKAPTADAGSDQTICADVTSVVLSGQVTGASGGEWTTTGTGNFSPNANTLNATYIPSTADTTSKNVTLTLTTTGNGNCVAVADQMIITFTPTPVVSASPDQTLCADVTSVNISGSIANAGGGIWVSSGSGSFSNQNSISTVYTPSAADKTSGSVILTISSTGNGTCQTYSSHLNLFFTPAPTINAGKDQTVCKDVTNISLQGTVSVAIGGTWSGGSGSFSNNNSLSTSYAPSVADKTTGSVTLTLTSSGNGNCNAVSDQVIINFTDAPTVSAGGNKNTCANHDTVQLHASFSVASGVQWISTGSGTFSPSKTDPNPVYYLSAGDKAAGNITLTISTTGNGTCNAVSDNATLTIAPKPVVNAGADITVCAGQGSAALAGSVINVGGGLWKSNGTGTFLNAKSLNTTYTPSATDIAKGGVILTLVSTSNGSCNADSDLVVLNIIPSPSALVNAGNDQTLCSDVSQVKLSGFVSNAGGGIWTSPGTGSFSPDANTLDAAYIPSAADIAAGTISLTLTTTNNGICSPVSDDVKITFTPAPTVNAGADQTICGDANAKVTLGGSVTVATGGMWSGGSGIFAPDAVTFNTVYFPSASEKTSGKATLTLTTTGNGTCNAVSDVMVISITKPPVVNAGNDITVCSNSNSISLSGKVTFATGGKWTTAGTGHFANSNSLSSSYNPSKADTAAKSVVLTLTSTGGCEPVSDDIKITFKSLPTVDAGFNQSVCADATSVQLSGQSSNTSSVIWTTSGTGVFNNSSSTNSSYILSDLDRDLPHVVLTITSVSDGICTPVSDDVMIILHPLPKAKIDQPQTCDHKGVTKLTGHISNATGGLWSTSGSGVFSPQPSILTPTYYPSNMDISAGSVTLFLTTTGNSGCTPAKHSSLLNFNVPLTANAGKDQEVCPGSTTTLTGVANTSVAYSWYSTSGTLIGNDASANVSVSSDTTFILQVTNVIGCTATDSVNVFIYQLPQFNMNQDYCLSNSLLLNANPNPQPNVPGTYQWFINNHLSPGSNSTIISPIDAGDYTIVFSYNNCSSSGSTTVNAPPMLIAKYIIDCENKNSDITLKSNQTGVNYLWSTGQTGTDLKTINISVLPDTNYYSATVTDSKGCSSIDSVRVIGIPQPMLTLSDVSSCEGQKIELYGKPTNITNIDSLYPQYSWFKNNQVLGISTDSLTVTNSGKYNLTLQIGQCTAMDSAIIAFNPNPVSALPDNTKFCKESDHYAVLDAGAGTGYSYQWMAPAGITLDSNNTRTVSAKSQGVYSIVITNSFNCTAIDSIQVNDICPPKVFVPNAFIPDSPGEDKVFKVFGEYFINYKMMIFNRWGEVIFISTDRNIGWDGTYRGQPMPEGVYPWIVTYEGEDLENKGPFKKEGSVTVVR